MRAALSHWRLWIPLLLFAGFLGFATYMMRQPKDDFVHSKMIGKQLPYFTLPPAVSGQPGLESKLLTDGRPRLLNIFASWCLPCAAEAPQLARLNKAGATIVGVDIRDRPEDVAAFLDRYGNPYQAIGADDVSRVQFLLGSSGVPETFVIDGKGRITYQHIGDIRADDVPLMLDKLREAGR